jgi:hypothetical protein
LRDDAQCCRKSQNSEETRCVPVVARVYRTHTLLCRE